MYWRHPAFVGDRFLRRHSARRRGDYRQRHHLHDREKLSGNSDSFGKGDIRGVAAPEAANNASACGSFIPMLTLGVPGSGTTAVMMGALTLYNITPGPAMFTEQPDIVWGLIAALLIANVMLLVMNIPLIGLFTRMLTIPLWFWSRPSPPSLRLGCTRCTAPPSTSVLMVLLGVLGYILRKMHFPMSPLILGFVLGKCWSRTCAAPSPSATATWGSCGKAA